ncbi:hypothetical protein GCM10009804_15330 [Kribbella hippodromi]|uniref:Uncharacterized protein n=1 Tax=Kribbella hippodromi TaxID=434347 RepID=A0ABN2CIX1_9ACTN
MKTMNAIKLLATVGLMLSLGACKAQDEDNSVATAGGGSSATTSASGSSSQADQYKFAQCMRENGMPDWPDPQADGSGGKRAEAPASADPQKVDAAREKCKQYLPNGGDKPKIDSGMVEQMRKLAQCMRENGVPKFPDPDANGGAVKMDPDSGIDPQSAEFKAAQQKCRQYQPTQPSAGTIGGS